MTDLAETIERLRKLTGFNDPPIYYVELKDLVAVLDAAERALALDSVGFTPSTPDIAAARDAALEDAAAEVERFCALDPDSKAIEQYLFASIARRIRALKGAA